MAGKEFKTVKLYLHVSKNADILHFIDALPRSLRQDFMREALARAMESDPIADAKAYVARRNALPTASSTCADNADSAPPEFRENPEFSDG